jgi:hypothetical protein
MILKTVKTSVVPIFIGVIIGWVGKSYQATGGIQLQFNDAVRRGDIAEMEKLILRGADPLSGHFYADMNDYGSLPIADAARACQPEAIEFLLKKGANPNELIATEAPLDLVHFKQRDVERSIKILEAHGAKTLENLDNNLNK